MAGLLAQTKTPSLCAWRRSKSADSGLVGDQLQQEQVTGAPG
jgi:hypothetical protein